MLLNDSLGIVGGNISIPCAFGIDHANRALCADSEALAFGPITGAIRPGEIELLEPSFDVVPGLGALGRIDAVGANADEEVAGELTDAEASGHDRWGEMFWICHWGQY